MKALLRWRLSSCPGARRLRGQSAAEVLLLTALLVAVFWGVGQVATDGALPHFLAALQLYLTRFGAAMAIPL